MKLLHTADWHLDSPIVGRSPEQTRQLRDALLRLPGEIVSLAKTEGCDAILIAGDIFDGPGTPESLTAVRNALQDAAMPVCIAPGNHDFYTPDSLWATQSWPENVHIFTKPHIESVLLEGLNCRIYGAAFTAPYSPGLLSDFHADGQEAVSIGLFHGDPTQSGSAYCPVTAQEVRESALDYLALGHIHKSGSFIQGDTLCAWPGCPMGRGYDETGEKGVLIVTPETRQLRFVPLDLPRFYDLQVQWAQGALDALLPGAAGNDFYRITITGEAESVPLEALQAQFSHLPNLQLRDYTQPPLDLWGSVGNDSLEGVYFGLLQQALEQADPAEQERILLSARISRQILDGREVVLP